MALAATAVLVKEQQNHEDHYRFGVGIAYTKNGIKHYPSLLHPPVHIDRIWKLLILHSEVYFEFCSALCGGIIHRKEPMTYEKDPILDLRIGEFYQQMDSLSQAINTAHYLELGKFKTYQNVSKVWRYDVRVVDDSTEQKDEDHKFDITLLTYPITLSQLGGLVDECGDDKFKTEAKCVNDVYDLANDIMLLIPK